MRRSRHAAGPQLCPARQARADPGGSRPARHGVPRELLRALCRVRLHRRARGEARRDLGRQPRLEGRAARLLERLHRRSTRSRNCASPKCSTRSTSCWRPHLPGQGRRLRSARCPTCGTGQLSLKLGKFGAFIGCSNYPECRYTMQLADAGSRPVSAATARSSCTTAPMPTCRMSRRSSPSASTGRSISSRRRRRAADVRQGPHCSGGDQDLRACRRRDHGSRRPLWAVRESGQGERHAAQDHGPADVTMEQALELLAERAAKTGGGRKAPAKKAAAKKAPAKKAAPKRQRQRRQQRRRRLSPPRTDTDGQSAKLPPQKPSDRGNSRSANFPPRRPSSKRWPTSPSSTASAT
jgi:ssDNA-binding Zn-finger/Zn-ribbon topoisomerase 1